MSDRRDFLKKALASGAAAVILNDLAKGEALARAFARTQGATAAAADDPWALVPEILKRIKPPVFPKRDFLITKYGAAAGGKSDCAAAIRKAVEACGKA